MGASWIRDRTHLHWQVDSLSLSTRESLSVILFEGLILCSGVPCLSAQLPERSTTDGWVLKQQNCRQKSRCWQCLLLLRAMKEGAVPSCSPWFTGGRLHVHTAFSVCVSASTFPLLKRTHTHTQKDTSQTELGLTSYLLKGLSPNIVAF